MTVARLVIGDLDVGAYGLTLLLKLQSVGGASLLASLVEQARRGEPARLENSAQVELRNLQSLDMSLAPRAAGKRLHRAAPGRLTWTCTAAEWDEVYELLKPFLEGHAGHQYLTSEGIDDALVEVSFNEPDVKL